MWLTRNEAWAAREEKGKSREANGKTVNREAKLEQKTARRSTGAQAENHARPPTRVTSNIT
jgi:hypothetical protein